MAGQKGRSLKIAVEDSPGSLTYTEVAGMRAKQFQFSNPSTDESDSNSPGQWRERGTGYALKDLAFSGSGLFKSHATQKKIFTALFNSSAALNYQITVPGLGVFVGPMTVDGIDFAGGHDSELTFNGNFASAGEIAYTPAA